MLICNNCGKLIDESDLATHKNYLSDYGDDCCYETIADKCVCGGEFEEAEKCDCCEEYCLEKDMLLGWRHNVQVCTGCVDFYKGKYERAYNQLSINDTDEFIDWLVDINEILEI